MKKLLIILSSFVLVHCGQPKPEIVSNKALEVVEKFNKKCPMMIDSETRIDGIEVKKPNTILYKYTLMHVSVENVDTALFEAALRPGIVNTLKTNPDLKEMRDLKANFEYYYKDRENKFIYSFLITPDDYND